MNFATAALADWQNGKFLTRLGLGLADTDRFFSYRRGLHFRIYPTLACSLYLLLWHNPHHQRLQGNRRRLEGKQQRLEVTNRNCGMSCF